MTNSEDRSSPATGVTVELAIRWGDMDAIGHVNNTVFFQYCESARIAYFDTLQIERFQQQPTEGPVIVNANLNFRRQLHYPGTVAVAANVTKISTRSFVLSYTIRDLADEVTVADGDSVVVWVDYEAGKAMSVPQAMSEAIAELERNPQLLARS